MVHRKINMEPEIVPARMRMLYYLLLGNVTTKDCIMGDACVADFMAYLIDHKCPSMTAGAAWLMEDEMESRDFEHDYIKQVVGQWILG